MKSVLFFRMGYALAIGVFPKFMLDGQLDLVMSRLKSSMALKPETTIFTESRRDMVFAYTK